MKILITMYNIQDYGGITSHTEALGMGLKELGHEVKLVGLRDSMVPVYHKKLSRVVPCNPSVFGSGVAYHLTAGWYGIPIFGYDVLSGVTQFRSYVEDNKFDQVIHSLPCPYKDHGQWRDLYNLGVPQMAVIHDAHYPRAYQHLNDVADDLEFVAPVNEAAVGALIDGGWPGAIKPINNGILLPRQILRWGGRRKQAICAHVWKRWKHMDRVVEAAPFLKSSCLIMGGDGLEGRYMRSKTKCPPRYEGMWGIFLDTPRASYMGILPPRRMFDLYNTSRLQIDLSSAAFSRYGCHYNRSIMEAGAWGCPSIVSDKNMVGSQYFEHGKTHFDVKDNLLPDELAQAIDYYVNCQFPHITDNIRDLISEHWDYQKTAGAHILDQ